MATAPIFVTTPVVSIASAVYNPARNMDAPFLWGSVNNAALGLVTSSATSRSSPTLVYGSYTVGVVQICNSGTNSPTYFIRNDGTAWALGTGTNGQAGDNTASSSARSSPVSVVGAHSFISICNAINAGSALKSDGSIWCWGTNTTGHVGDNTTSNRSSPVSIVGNHSFIALTGATCFAGLKIDGSAWFWGQNSGGIGGDNSSSARSSPTSVIGAHSFIQISSGTQQAVALKIDGSAWCWGTNTSGGIGDNTTTSRSSPVSVVGAHSFVLVGSGGFANYALKSDGSCWSWGAGGGGALGDNQVTSRSSPVSVVGNHSFTTISPYFQGVLALKSDNSLWAWGINSSFEFGNLSNVNRSSPISIASGYRNLTTGASRVINGGLTYGPIATVVTGTGSGTKIETITIKGRQGNPGPLIIRLWLSDTAGLNFQLYKEQLASPTDMLGTASGYQTTLSLNLILPAGVSLGASISTSEDFSIVANGGVY